MAEFVGFSDNLYFFRQGDKGVLVDSTLNVIVASGDAEVLGNQKLWEPLEASSDAQGIAELALSVLDSSITASAPSRMYTIPKAAQEEAKKALEWHKEHKRGGTSVGMNTARTLAEGGQIGLKKVRHIAKYFPRHEVDKKGKGWKPGQDGFPSNGRIAWALWGGDPAWRWARAIVESEDKKPITASASYLDLSAFSDTFDSNEIEGPEFIARLFTDSLLIDRLYKVDPDGATFVWDDGQWSDLGEKNQDIWSYDAILDAGQVFSDDNVTHVTVDPDSAIYLAGRIYERPQELIPINDIDEVEAGLAADAVDGVDWSFIDQTLVAAGEPTPTTTPSSDSATNQDGNYTPEERSAKAKGQVRDATGKFTKTGSRVVIGGDPKNGAGQITKINPAQGTVTVKLDNGNSIDVKGKMVEPETAATPDTVAPEVTTKLDTSGILAEPRTPMNRGIAQIPGTLPAMTSKDIQNMLADWPAWVQSQREAYIPGKSSAPAPVQGKNSKNLGSRGEKFLDSVGRNLLTDAYDHPLLKKWLDKQDSNGKHPNRLWYNPVTAAGVVKELTPQTSDVQPVYMAIVDPDDPRAVLSLVSLIPANSQSNAPMTYTRQDGKWVRDPKALADLKSATPPPVVPLDSDTLEDVLIQVDETQGVTASLAITVLFGNRPIVAAGGLDRNRGKAEELRKYWTRGEGALKIRWGTPGDWTRCYRNLKKYMGVRAKGYCALRHKEMNGMWPGEHNKQFVTNQFGTPEFTDSVLRSEDQILEMSMLNIRKEQVKARVASGFDMNLGDVNVDVDTFFFHEKEPMPVDIEKIVSGMEPVDEQDIAIEDLIPSQNTVNMRRIEAIVDSMKPVKVLITEAGPVLVDGHHRTVAHMLLGRDTVPAKIYKLEESE